MTLNPAVALEPLRPLLGELERLRQEIEALEVPAPLDEWLRRNVEARGAHMSTSIEGNPLTEPEVRELFVRPREVVDRAEKENLDYRDAARFARAIAGDFHADFDGGLVRALHYLVVRSTYRYGEPAQWRTAQNRVSSPSGETVYLPPPPGDVPRLMSDLEAWLQGQRTQLHPLLLAAIAHIEFVNIHPFDDGNGRTARAITTYFAERGGWGLRGFVSSEAVFGLDRQEYYRRLSSLGYRYDDRGDDLSDWCEWVLRAFAIEAATACGVVRKWVDHLNEGPSTRWAATVNRGYMYLALNREVSRAEYVAAVGVSPGTAVKQLNILIENMGGDRIGAGRSTRYRLWEDRAGEIASEARWEARERIESL